MSGSDALVKVLSVVGAGRSGTTVLASILGEIDGFASAGELRWLWERGVLAERPCGCGRKPTDCPVWSPVVAKTLADLGAGTTHTTVDEIVAAQHEVARRGSFVRLLRSIDGDTDAWEALRLVRSATASACRALTEVTGARVVVDTSKRASDAAVLAGLPDVDHYVLHIVRDPRAVVHSWSRAKTFTTAGQTRTMGTRGLPSSARRWMSNGLSAEALRRRLPDSRWLHMRYEDFATEPRQSVQRLLDLMGEGGGTPFEDDHTVRLNPNHIVAGNPSRFTTGSVTIRADDAWRRQMPRRNQQAVAALTLPLMLRYGYLRHGQVGSGPRP
jgi:hypothetical protein